MARLYARRAATLDRRATSLRARGNWISHLRVGSFAASLACAAGGIWGPSGRGVLLLIAGCLGAVFVGLVAWHRRLRAAEDRCHALATINRHAHARVRRDWTRLPPPKIEASISDPPLAHDLDLFGRSSLAQLLGGGGATALGRDMLRGWVLEPASPATIAARQLAVAELAPQLNRRQRFIERARHLTGEVAATQRFLAWAESPPWMAQRPWLHWVARLLPLFFVLSVVAQSTGLTSIPIWQGLLIANVAISLLLARTVRDIFNRLAYRAGDIAQYAELFQLVGAREARSELLRAIESEMNQTDAGARSQLSRLARLLTLADLRYSQMAHAIVQAVTLWDFHVLAAIERWQRRSGTHARAWFTALAEWDALAALAVVSHDNPAWAFPTLTGESQPILVTARKLCHPLLPADGRIANDVSLGPTGTFLLVTGSNMSGKSTLLRSIGLNVVLAQAGGPVAAEEFRLPPVRLATSMRIEDSLADGTSLFMAELKRLKQVVDAAREQKSTGQQRRLLYLLDEILHGTNSVERQIAVRRVMLHLLDEGAIGAISTHDLALASVAPLDTAGQPVHFQESFSDGPAGRRMTFDYKLRDGLATTTNALALLDLVGLTPPDGGDAPATSNSAAPIKN